VLIKSFLGVNNHDILLKYESEERFILLRNTFGRCCFCGGPTVIQRRNLPNKHACCSLGGLVGIVRAEHACCGLGGLIGGLIGGQDKGERADNVLIRATPGEYMLDRPTVRHYGVSALEALRRRSVPRELLEPFASPRLPASGGKRTAYALGGEIGNGSLTEGGKASGNEGLTVINVMDFQREFDRALASTRGRRVLINILGEEGIAS